MEKSLQELLEEAMGKSAQHFYIPSEEGKQKIREARLGTTLSEETRARMSAKRKGRPHSKSHRESLTASNKARAGTPLEQTHRDNQSKAAKERWATNPYKPSAEVIEKRRQATLKTNAEKRAAMPPKVVEPPKKRGRPKTRTLPDPTLPKRGRGRPPKVSSH